MNLRTNFLRQKFDLIHQPLAVLCVTRRAWRYHQIVMNVNINKDTAMRNSMIPTDADLWTQKATNQSEFAIPFMSFIFVPFISFYLFPHPHLSPQLLILPSLLAVDNCVEFNFVLGLQWVTDCGSLACRSSLNKVKSHIPLDGSLPIFTEFMMNGWIIEQGNTIVYH